MLNLADTISKANNFLNTLESKRGFKLFIGSDTSPYARCFVIFGKALIKDEAWLRMRREELIQHLNHDLHCLYQERIVSSGDWRFDKPLLQLLCFTLSALDILGGSLSDQNRQLIDSLVKHVSQMRNCLEKRGVACGFAGSGNYAMFVAIICIYASANSSYSNESQMNDWINYHVAAVNKNGFWSLNKCMDHSQFQNGYHQYEIFEYLGFEGVPWKEAARNTLSLCDNLGHFAPYPGGGGCYDYDAIFMLTSKLVGDIGQSNILNRSLNTIISEQNIDGGFCESKLIRSNGSPQILALLRHVWSQPACLRLKSLKIGLNLFRPKHRVVTTHWTNTHRRWDESNAWDTFFRLSAISRICNYMDIPQKNMFSPCDFPGIG